MSESIHDNDAVPIAPREQCSMVGQHVDCVESFDRNLPEPGADFDGGVRFQRESDMPADHGRLAAELEEMRAERARLEAEHSEMVRALNELQQRQAALREEHARFEAECRQHNGVTLQADELSRETEIGITGDSLSEIDAAKEETPFGEPREDATLDAISPEISSAPVVDLQRFSKLFPKVETPAPSSEKSPPPSPRPGDFQLEDTDPDSVNSYMERLLERSRGRTGHLNRVTVVPANEEIARNKTDRAVVSPQAAPAAESDRKFKEQSEAPPPVVIRERPKYDTEQARAGLGSLREVANKSARQALTQHFWKRYRSSLMVRVTLIVMSFALCAVLYFDHGLVDPLFSPLAWSAASIGVITFCGLVHTLHVAARLKTREFGGRE
jgi:hypothetical protein